MLFAESHSPPTVWAVEDTSIQVTWGDLPLGLVQIRCRHAHAQIEHVGGAGAIDLHGLPPDQDLSIELSWPGGSTELTAQTLPTPSGEELSRFATISDLHLGADKWGLFNTMVDPSDHSEPFALRCAVAAINEAVAWGAQFLIIKGDAADDETAGHFDLVGNLVDRYPELPMIILPGNHDVHSGGTIIPTTVGRRKLRYTRRVDHVDLPGVRIIGADVTVPGRGWGRVDRVGPAIVSAARESAQPVFLATHQQLQPTRLPRQWPMGVPAPASTNLIDQLDQLSQPVMISAGHTHRNRSWRRGSVLLTEVGSTRDWPGVWAGYAVHEGGMRQVVRRVAAPSAIGWTEYSRGALNGLWSHWSPGQLEQRCMAHLWAHAGNSPISATHR